MTLILETSTGRSTLETLRERYDREPRSKLFMPLADQLRVRGEYGEAIDLCTRGKVLHPRYVSCRVLLGKCLMELGLKEEAQSELEEVLKLDRENIVSLRVMAEILRAEGDLEGAADYYRAALRINPMDIDAQERLAVLMRLQQSHEDGETGPSVTYEEARSDEAESTSCETIELDATGLSLEWDGFSSDEFRPVEGVVRDPVQFFNYEVGRSDFSKFTEWINKVSQERSDRQQTGEGQGRHAERSTEQDPVDRE
ncbi:MAG: hypothetical protein AMJ46_01700 [Latescibacteria bacterium DG_63]|nr:MAG: hypothetical protein AMJ46_01700 [Latescibacteria bacterium DG_63]